MLFNYRIKSLGNSVAVEIDYKTYTLVIMLYTSKFVVTRSCNIICLMVNVLFLIILLFSCFREALALLGLLSS